MYRLLLLCAVLSSPILHMSCAKSIIPEELTVIAPRQNKTRDLVYIGGTQTKAYFTALNEDSWADAKAYCQSIQMNIASVENQAELDVLMNAEHNDGLGGIKGAYFHGTHWVAARDARTSRQFVWDRNNASLSDTLPFRDDIGLVADGNFLTCGVFGVYADRRGFGFQACNARGYNVICEATSTSASN